MIHDKQELLKAAWVAVHPTAFDIDALTREVIRQCGVDAAGLTPDDLKSLFRGSLNNHWKDIAFAFDEGLAAILAGPIDGKVFTAAVFMSLYLGEAIHRGYGDWEFSFDKICKLIIENCHCGDCLWRMAFFRELLNPHLE